ncbi:hypothetical protein A6B43_03595 [Vespertiliibacter pulmonis]|uniref:Chorismate lyase n=1 Tax=Vespertiliibacter pulmonis TaxID=1443036 RepID=A0A3N4VLK2_9PAST|nr:chorismate lyase [Vespertiliibacter pulmonis]QLB20669.1 hypothetical protein A6B43_03595 [Vespertiliibacter pulmonis]RPE82553.1 chorismate lyase [Vespertiliibacter pulmonis]
MNNLPFSAYREIFCRTKWHTDLHLLPQSVREWVGYTGSLTQKLQGICQSLTVELTEQKWQAVSSLPQFAKNSSQQTAWLREVVLKSDGIPSIFAQTILAETTVQNVAQEILTLGEKPIGLWLFPQNPKRLNLEWAFDEGAGLYARRSYFTLKDYPFAIYELFLPQFSFESLHRTE